MTQKNQKQQVWGARLSSAPHALNIEFCAGRDVKSLPMADEVLLKYDIWTNLAHATMLNKVGVLSGSELKELKTALLELIELSDRGEFALDPNKEDVHIPKFFPEFVHFFVSN